MKAADEERVRRHELTKGVCCLIALVAGTFFGLSPLILPVSAVFGDNSGVFFYGVAVLTVGYTTTSMVACFHVVYAPLPAKQRFVTSGIVAWPIAFAALAAAVQLRALPLLFAAFLLMGFCVGVVISYLHLVELAICWGEDVRVGHAVSGGVSATCAMLWTLAYGETIHALGAHRVATALWLAAAVHATGCALTLAFQNPAHHLNPPMVRPRGGGGGGGGSDGESDGGDARASPLHACAICDWKVAIFVFLMEVFWFAGITMKHLLSVLFEDVSAAPLASLALVARPVTRPARDDDATARRRCSGWSTSRPCATRRAA